MKNQTENPLVSIIVRTKDRPILLKRALQSIAAQTYSPIEVVLVNDGGCDLDIEELKNILGDVSLNYIRLEQNTGRAHAANVGLKNVEGEYIGFLDDDDEFYPEHVETLVTFLKNSDFKVAYTDSLMVYIEYNAHVNDFASVKSELIFSKDFDYNFLLFENYIPFMCLLFKRDVILGSGGFDVSFSLYEDWDLLIRIAEKHPFYHIKKSTAIYNLWDSESQISQQNRNVSFLKKAYMRILSKHSGKITPESIHNYMLRHVALREELKRYKNNIDNIKSLRYKIDYLKSELREKQRLLTLISQESYERNQKLLNVEKSLREKEALISAMINTKGWRLLESCRRFKKSFFNEAPAHTQENILIKGIKVLRRQGLRALIQKANKKFLFNKSIKSLPVGIDTSFASNILDSDIDNTIEAKVSVIIPTKNAGDEFDYILRRITQQEYIGEIEIIIVDSGSSDNTLEIAKKYSASIFQIEPVDFHHARTRNFGAEKATGEFLVFTVQDAIPVGNKWLYKLLSPIHSGKVTSVSSIQIPRSDADLFSCWSYWSHYLKFLGRDSDHLIKAGFEGFDKLDERGKRIVASLDNVSMGIKKEIFDLYQFNADYAEDIELGVKLIKNGHSILFQSTNAVVHSHNRPPLYYMERSYLDRIAVCSILNIKRNSLSSKLLMESLCYIYEVLKKCLEDLKSLKGDPSYAVQSLIDDIYLDNGQYNPSFHSLQGDTGLDAFFRKEIPVNHQSIVVEIKNIFCDNLRSFADYLSKYHTIEGAEQNLICSIYKIFGNVAGSYIAANTKDEIKALRGGV